MCEFLCKVSDARANNPVKVIGLTLLISGLLLSTFPIGLGMADWIQWSSYGAKDMFGILILILSVAGILGMFVAFMMVLGQLMDILNEKTSKMEEQNRNRYNSNHHTGYSGYGFGVGDLDEYEKDAMECQMYHTSFMITHGQNPLDYDDWVDHTFDPFGFGDD